MTEQNMKKNVIWNAIGNITYLVCQWVVTVLVTVIGGFEDAGVLSIAMSVSATVQTLAMFGIRSYQVSDLKNKYTDTCYVGFRTLTCALAMIVCVIFSLVSGYLGGQLLAICLFMIFRLAESYADVLHGIAQKNGRLDIAGKSFTVKGIGLLICFLVGYVLSKELNIGLLCMMLFSLSVTLVYDLPSAKRLAIFSLLDTPRHCARLAMETLPLFVYLFLYSALSTVPKLILEGQCGEVILGAYSSIFAPAMLLQAATGYLYNPFATQFAQHLGEGDRKKFCSLLIKIVLAMLVIAIVVMFLAQFLGEFALVLVFGEKIKEYVLFLNPILIVNFAISFLGFFCMLTVVLRKFKRLLLGCGAAFAICLFLTKPLIGQYEANGCSYSLILACVVGIAVLATGTALDVYKINQKAISDKGGNE